MENRSEVVGRRVRIKGVIGAGVSGSRGERPGTMKDQALSEAVGSQIHVTRDNCLAGRPSCR